MIRTKLNKAGYKFLKWVLYDKSHVVTVGAALVAAMFAIVILTPVGEYVVASRSPVAATQTSGERAVSTARPSATPNTAERSDQWYSPPAATPVDVIEDREADETAATPTVDAKLRVEADDDVSLAKAEAAQVADVFVSNLVLSESRSIDVWLATLRPVVTDKLYATLETGDLNPKTGARTSELGEVTLTDETAKVSIGMTDGSTVNVTLVYADEWLVRKVAFKAER